VQITLHDSSVENFYVAAFWGRLRRQTFFSLAEANAAIAGALDGLTGSEGLARPSPFENGVAVAAPNGAMRRTPRSRSPSTAVRQIEKT